jgi:hypothetical protein
MKGGEMLQPFYILPVVLYGCETWSFALKSEHGLRKCAEENVCKERESKRRMKKIAN